MTTGETDIIGTIDAALCALRSAMAARQVYWAEHPAAVAPTAKAFELLTQCLRSRESVEVMFLPDRVICGDRELQSSGALAPTLGARVRSRGTECVTFSRGLAAPEIAGLLEALCAGAGAVTPGSAHIRCGSLHVSASGGGDAGLGAGTGLSLTGAAASEACRAHSDQVRALWGSIQGGIL